MKNVKKVITIKEIKNSIVSIIVPALNEEKYIEKTLFSIRAQTIKRPYEIIVSDGNSKDNTIKIAKKSMRIKLLFQKKEARRLVETLGQNIQKENFLFCRC